MKFSLKTLLYIVIAAGAIFVGLTFFDNEPQADFSALEAMREGDMKKLNFSAPKPFVETAFVGEDGQPMNFEAFKGQYTVVNFWATWCAPCIAEMPQLDALAAREARKLQVLTVSQDLEGAAKVTPFFAKGGYKALKPYLDDQAALSTHYQANLPTTILYDSTGHEVWRYSGGQDWTGAAAAKLIAEAR